MWINGRHFKPKTCKVSVDGVDCRIWEPAQPLHIRQWLRQNGHRMHPYDPRYKSHKFAKAGLRYEIGICIRTGDIVWVNGPYPCGAWPDIKIFRHKLKHKLAPGEQVEADNGYRGEPMTVRQKKEYVSRVDRKAKATALNRHECENALVKKWGCLNQNFRHHIKNHGMCFAACATLTQMSIENGFGVWQVRY